MTEAPQARRRLPPKQWHAAPAPWLYCTRVPSSSGDQWVEYLPHHLHDSPDYLCVLLVRQEDITRCVPRYVHWGHTYTWEITCSWSRRSNKNQCHFCTEIDNGGLLVWQILRTCYWIHTRSGTTAAFYLSFYKLTLFLILNMFVRLSFRKWFRQAWPRNCAQWRSWH